MRALIKHTTGTSLQTCDLPTPPPNWVRVRVSHVGVCRTDVYVAQGRIPVETPRILGHECSGTVDALGESAAPHLLHRPVGIMPIIPCGRCPNCVNDDPLVCHAPKMLGMALDGAFAQYVIVPQDNVYCVGDMDPKLAAYLEPIAASLAILQAPITAQMRGLIYGDNRIARLTQTILRTHGFEHIDVHSPNHQRDDTLPSHHYDFCVETLANTVTMDTLMRVVKSRGVIILKSRPAEHVGIDFRAALQKELTLRATQYAPFEHAIDYAQKHPNSVEHLLGQCHPLAAYEEVFANGGLHGDKKAFLLPWS